jgi:acylphosphatase
LLPFRDCRSFAGYEPVSEDSFHNERRHVYYTGHVQGVGFRYTVQRIARSFPVTGYVRNLEDGRVELLIEGPPRDLDDFLAEVVSRMGHFMRQADCRRGEATGEYVGFGIWF